MKKLTMFLVAAVAAATVAIGALSVAPPASAMPQTCSDIYDKGVMNKQEGDYYKALADLDHSVYYYHLATYYYNRAIALMQQAKACYSS
jgi:hypothetical protein